LTKALPSCAQVRPGIGVDGLISMMVLEPKLIAQQRIQIGFSAMPAPSARSPKPKSRKQPHAK